MGKCSRRKRQQNQNLKKGHSPHAAPRTATLPTGDPVIDFLSKVNLTDLLTPPSEPEPEPVCVAKIIDVKSAIPEQLL